MNVLLTRAIICLSIALSAVSWAQAQQTRTIYLVRHADKVSDETDAPLSEAARFLNQGTGVNNQIPRMTFAPGFRLRKLSATCAMLCVISLVTAKE